MSDKKRSSASKRRDAYRGRFEKNYVKARNPWPDPFASKEHNRTRKDNRKVQ